MSKFNANTRRIFGGLPADDGYKAPPHDATQDDKESVTAGTTVRRVFKGPVGSSGSWSYHFDVTAGGATSTLKFYFSDLPNPNPATAAHWKDSGITPIDLAVTATGFVTRTADYPEWIMAEVVAVTSAPSLWLYARVAERDN